VVVAKSRITQALGDDVLLHVAAAQQRCKNIDGNFALSE